MKKRIFICLVFLFVLIISIPVSASSDLFDKKGSITLRMEFDGTVVRGGTITLFQVGKLTIKEGDFAYISVPDFHNFDGDINDIYSSVLAQRLSVFAETNNVSGQTKTIDQNGTVAFSNIDVGLYLLVQTQAAKGYYKVSPFLVAVPQSEDGSISYEVDASPKVELRKRPGSTNPPAGKPSGNPPSEDNKLPQTGQLNWPIPVCAFIGILLVCIGYILRFGRKSE